MRREAERLARLAGGRYRFRRLNLFGSVARSARLAVWSDIDLAVEGLAPEDYWPLVGMLTAEAKYPLDVKGPGGPAGGIAERDQSVRRGAP